jgi:hypothetical protein
MVFQIFPISFGTALQMPPVKLMNALRGDGAVLFTGERGGNFLPRFASLALFTYETHERFKAAVESASAATAFALHRLGVVDELWIHQRTV